MELKYDRYSERNIGYYKNEIFEIRLLKDKNGIYKAGFCELKMPIEYNTFGYGESIYNSVLDAYEKYKIKHNSNVFNSIEIAKEVDQNIEVFE